MFRRLQPKLSIFQKQNLKTNNSLSPQLVTRRHQKSISELKAPWCSDLLNPLYHHNWDTECMDTSYSPQSRELPELVKRYTMFLSKSLIHYSWVGRQHRHLLLPTAFFVCTVKKCKDSLWRLDHWKKLIIRNCHKYSHYIANTKSCKVYKELNTLPLFS